jgi:hypothetical protein
MAHEKNPGAVRAMLRDRDRTGEHVSAGERGRDIHVQLLFSTGSQFNSLVAGMGARWKIDCHCDARLFMAGRSSDRGRNRAGDQPQVSVVTGMVP